jgi:hypothetical protein
VPAVVFEHFVRPAMVGGSARIVSISAFPFQRRRHYRGNGCRDDIREKCPVDGEKHREQHDGLKVRADPKESLRRRKQFSKPGEISQKGEGRILRKHVGAVHEADGNGREERQRSASDGHGFHKPEHRVFCAADTDRSVYGSEDRENENEVSRRSDEKFRYRRTDEFGGVRRLIRRGEERLEDDVDADPDDGSVKGGIRAFGSERRERSRKQHAKCHDREIGIGNADKGRCGRKEIEHVRRLLASWQ